MSTDVLVKSACVTRGQLSGRYTLQEFAMVGNLQSVHRYVQTSRGDVVHLLIQVILLIHSLESNRTANSEGKVCENLL